MLPVRQMMEQMIFIVGLSAGGAMTSAMLATYPDVFADGAIIVGLPYSSASNVQEAFEYMAQGGDRLKSGRTMFGTLLPTAGHGRVFHCGMAWHR